MQAGSRFHKGATVFFYKHTLDLTDHCISDGCTVRRPRAFRRGPWSVDHGLF